MSFDVWNLVLYILVVICCVDARRLRTFAHRHNKKVHLHPSKRVEIPHPIRNNEYITAKSYRRQEVIHALSDNMGSIGDADDDDIESLGKTIDATGHVVKENKSIIKQPKVNITKPIVAVPVVKSEGATKSIIEKIKEIQDRIFKRTGSKELEEKLKLMSPPLILPEIKIPLTAVQPDLNKTLVAVNRMLKTSSVSNKTLNIPEGSSTNIVVKTADDSTLTKARDTLRNDIKLTDGSKQPDRRKIIPEEVVDKILEKFQQLRQEAKHMALLENQHTDKETVAASQSKAVEQPQGPINPYASIGPAQQNGDLKNRTQPGSDVTPIGMDPKQDVPLQPPDPPSQLPSSESLNMAALQFPMSPVGNDPNPNIKTPIQQNNNVPNNGNAMPGLPLMFIKNGQMLVPVFGNANSNTGLQGASPINPMTVTGNGMAQLNSNIGVAMPQTPSNVFPMATPNVRSPSFMNIPSQSSTKTMFQMNIPNNNENMFLNPNLNNMNNNNNLNNNNNNNNGQTAKALEGASALQAALLSMLANRNNNNNNNNNNGYSPLPALNIPGMSRCGIPGQSCHSPTNFMNTEPIMQPAPQVLPQEQRFQPQNNRMMEGDYPSTAQLIKSIMMNSPGLSQIASTFGTDFSNNDKPMTGDQRSFNSLPMFPHETPVHNQGNMESSSPASIQFALQQNLANNNPNREVQSPINNQQQQQQQPALDLQKVINQFSQPPNLPNSQLSSYGENNLERPADTSSARRDEPMFHGKSQDTNDISDPPADIENPNNLANRINNREYSRESPMPQSQDPDELLEIAKMKSMQKEFQTSRDDLESSPVANIDQNAMDPTRMSSSDGGQERSMMNAMSGVDPSTLLDKIHGAQLKQDLMGAGDPNWFSPTYKESIQRDKKAYGGSPDDLLEMLRKQNGNMFHKSFDVDKSNEFSLGRSSYREEPGKNRAAVPFNIDPSLADEIPDNEGLNQHFEVQDKDLLTDSKNNNDFVNKDYLSSHGPISVLSDGLVQYKHGQMSMDGSNLVNQFLQDQQSFRNQIAHPNITSNDTKAIVRASISNTLPEDNIELRINGKKFMDKANLRSKIIDGKIVNIKGKTLSSKSPVKIELSHGINKSKIINIVTQGKYNVTDDTRKRKRGRIPKTVQIKT